jgi:hypothetical protein
MPQNWESMTAVCWLRYFIVGIFVTFLFHNYVRINQQLSFHYCPWTKLKQNFDMWCCHDNEKLSRVLSISLSVQSRKLDYVITFKQIEYISPVYDYSVYIVHLLIYNIRRWAVVGRETKGCIHTRRVLPVTVRHRRPWAILNCWRISWRYRMYRKLLTRIIENCWPVR